ncbi:MAG TPA: alpha/beta hydrolase-fold protein [Candidatus Koribacter sp.]|jgi:predicted alpha/beta superfamily hydrolase
MTKLLLVFLALISFAAATEPEHTVTGDVEIVPFTSKIFGNTRNLRILLPPGYRVMQNRHSRYPVMYMQDGQNLYDVATTPFGQEWQVDETIQLLWSEKKIAPMIIVGIDNAGEKRAEEYLPYRDEKFSPQVTQPRAADYARFLIEEVMPYVEQHYRVKTGPENTGLGGSSYGGLVSLYTVMQHPGIFGHLLIESMPLQIENGRLIQDAEATKQWPDKIFLGIGTKETNSPAMAAEHVQWTLRLERALRQQGLGPDRLKYVAKQGAQHNEHAWAERFPKAMLFLWPQ